MILNQVFHQQLAFYQVSKIFHWIVGGMYKKGDKFNINKNFIEILQHILLN